MGNNKYSDEFKRDVLAIATAATRSITQLERALDISAGVIYARQQRCRVGDEIHRWASNVLTGDFSPPVESG